MLLETPGLLYRCLNFDAQMSYINGMPVSYDLSKPSCLLNFIENFKVTVFFKKMIVCITYF